MKYIINFQITLTFEGELKSSLSSTYTIMETEIQKNKLSNFNNIQKWFEKIFSNTPLDTFIDISKFSNKITNKEIKIGRITNSVSGEYKTF